MSLIKICKEDYSGQILSTVPREVLSWTPQLFYLWSGEPFLFKLSCGVFFLWCVRTGYSIGLIITTTILMWIVFLASGEESIPKNFSELSNVLKEFSSIGWGFCLYSLITQGKTNREHTLVAPLRMYLTPWSHSLSSFFFLTHTDYKDT